MYNWKLPQVNLRLNPYRMALFHHTIFTEAMDKNLSGVKSSRSELFFNFYFCENKENAFC